MPAESGGTTRRAGTDPPVEGVAALDHTADVGLEVRASDLAGLLERAIRGMDWLLREAPPPDAAERRPLALDARNAPALLRACLREALLHYEADGYVTVRLDVSAISPTTLRAEAVGGIDPGEPVREIKGVTLHELAAERNDDGWYGRVIFDV